MRAAKGARIACSGLRIMVAANNKRAFSSFQAGLGALTA